MLICAFTWLIPPLLQSLGEVCFSDVPKDEKHSVAECLIFHIKVFSIREIIGSSGTIDVS